MDKAALTDSAFRAASIPGMVSTMSEHERDLLLQFLDSAGAKLDEAIRDVAGANYVVQQTDGEQNVLGIYSGVVAHRDMLRNLVETIISEEKEQ